MKPKHAFLTVGIIAAGAAAIWHYNRDPVLEALNNIGNLDFQKRQFVDLPSAPQEAQGTIYTFKSGGYWLETVINSNLPDNRTTIITTMYRKDPIKFGNEIIDRVATANGMTARKLAQRLANDPRQMENYLIAASKATKEIMVMDWASSFKNGTEESLSDVSVIYYFGFSAMRTPEQEATYDHVLSLLPKMNKAAATALGYKLKLPANNNADLSKFSAARRSSGKTLG